MIVLLFVAKMAAVKKVYLIGQIPGTLIVHGEIMPDQSATNKRKGKVITRILLLLRLLVDFSLMKCGVLEQNFLSAICGMRF